MYKVKICEILYEKNYDQNQKQKNVVEHGRQIIFLMCGLKYEKIYFNVMDSSSMQNEVASEMKLNIKRYFKDEIDDCDTDERNGF